MGLLDDFSSEFSDSDEDDSPIDDAVDRVIEDLDDEEIDDELREAEARLSKAAYYKAIVRGGVIEEDGSRESTEINAEARLWARQMMVRLLKGGTAEAPAVQVEALFTPNEVRALKLVAGKLLASQGEKAVDPVVKKVQAQPTPVRGPQVKVQPATHGAARPKMKPKAPTPPPKASRQAPATSQPTAPKRVKRARADAQGNVNYDAFENDEVFKDVDGQLYKMIPHPSEDNYRVKRKVSTQVRSADGDAKPMPSPQEMEQISAAQAMQTIDAGASASSSLPGGELAGTARHFIAAAAGSLNKE